MIFLQQRKSPEKTWLNCFINEVLRPLRFFRLGPYSHGEKQLTDLNRVLNYAKKKVKLDDIGDPEFKEHYYSIMQSDVQRKQKYTNLGYISASIELNMNFCRRLNFIQYLKDVPAVKNIEVWFV